MRKLHCIVLTPVERTDLLARTQTGAAPARVQTRARILLKADQSPAGPGWTNARIAEALETSPRTVARMRRAWVCDGGLAAIPRKRPRVRTPRKLDGAGKANLVALACSPAPDGRARWTLQLLAAKLVELEIVDGIAPNTVRTTLKKTASNPG
jgi:hypothetical protein